MKHQPSVLDDCWPTEGQLKEPVQCRAVAIAGRRPLFVCPFDNNERFFRRVLDCRVDELVLACGGEAAK